MHTKASESSELRRLYFERRGGGWRLPITYESTLHDDGQVRRACRLGQTAAIFFRYGLECIRGGFAKGRSLLHTAPCGWRCTIRRGSCGRASAICRATRCHQGGLGRRPTSESRECGSNLGVRQHVTEVTNDSSCLSMSASLRSQAEGLINYKRKRNIDLQWDGWQGWSAA